MLWLLRLRLNDLKHVVRAITDLAQLLEFRARGFGICSATSLKLYTMIGTHSKQHGFHDNGNCNLQEFPQEEASIGNLAGPCKRHGIACLKHLKIVGSRNM